MRTFRIALWALVAVVAVMVGVLSFRAMAPEGSTVAGFATPEIGGPFELVGTDGRTVTRDDLLGRPHVLFFGYTHCPDVCPTTVWELSEHLKKLGPAGDGLRLVFVSVDPERDTPEVLGEYVSAFDPRIVGLTGSREAVDEAVRVHRAQYRIHPPDEHGDILVDHTASVFLFDADGAFRGTIAYGEPAATAFEKLRRLVSA